MKKLLILLGFSLVIGAAMAVPARAGITIELGNGGIHIAKPYYGKHYNKPKYRQHSYRRYFGQHQRPGRVYYRPWSRYGSHSSHRRQARPFRDRSYRYDDDQRYYGRNKRRDGRGWSRHRQDRRGDDYRRMKRHN